MSNDAGCVHKDAGAQEDFNTFTAQDLVRERGSFRGKFSEQALVSQRLKQTFRSDPANWGRLSAAQKEAMDNMANKMARILTGDPNEKDAWDDIGGYAIVAQKDVNK